MSVAPVERASLLVVCTGNATRSVMAGLMIEHLAARHGAALSVATAGTHVVDGLPLGARTLAALRSVGELAGVEALAKESPGWAAHRSRQLCAEDLEGVDLVVAMEVGHVRHVRRRHPEAAARTAQLRWLAWHLEPGPTSLETRVSELGLEHVEPDPADDVADPAGHDDAAYAACAAELWSLCNELVPRLV